MVSGNLGKDPESRYLADGTLVVTLSLAVHSRRKQGDEYVEDTDWYNVSVWGTQGEWIANTLKSGMGVIVEGRLRQSKWMDAATMQKRIKVEIVGDSIYLLPHQGESDETRTGTNEEQESPDEEVPVSVPPTQTMKVTPFPQSPSVPRRPQGPSIRPNPKRVVEEDDDIPF